ncbi:MAG: hypothetical protein ACODAG_08130 [Myxococcota bacterium]
MSFNFETFDKRAGRLVKAPEMTIQGSGAVSLNAAAAHLLGEPKAVELLFDRQEQVIGIRGVPTEAPHAYPLRPVGKERGTYVIACRAFFLYYDIPIGVPTRRDVRLHDDILIVDLKDPGRVAISNRKRGELRKAAESGNGAAQPDGQQAALTESPSGRPPAQG